MKKIVFGFLKRGFTAGSIGPMVLVICYLCLQRFGGIRTLTVNEVCIGILSLTALSFVAGGMNVIYEVESLPLAAAIFIHGLVLYLGYLATYLVNDWLESGIGPFLAFSCIFVFGFLAIWAGIYIAAKKKANKLNAALIKKRESGA